MRTVHLVKGKRPNPEMPLLGRLACLENQKKFLMYIQFRANQKDTYYPLHQSRRRMGLTQASKEIQRRERKKKIEQKKERNRKKRRRNREEKKRQALAVVGKGLEFPQRERKQEKLLARRRVHTRTFLSVSIRQTCTEWKEESEQKLSSGCFLPQIIN